MLQVSNAMIASWVGFFSVSLVVYFMFSDGDFSFLLTYASLMRSFGLVLLVAKIQRTRSAAGVSAKTLQCYVVVFLMRLFSILRHEGYLPYDRSGDWLYHCLEGIALCATCTALYLVQFHYAATYEESHDSFGSIPNLPSELGALCIIVPAAVFAILIHPSLNKDWFSDTTWTYSMYLESFAILPQLFLFQKQSSTVATVEMLIGEEDPPSRDMHFRQ